MNKSVVNKKSSSKKKYIAAGVAHINASFNNTIVSVSDMQGDVVSWSSSGSNAFRGSKKSTPYAAQVTAEKAIKKAMELGLKTVYIKVTGPGAGRDSAIRAVANLVTVTAIKDITPVPHNGVRPRKQRRMQIFYLFNRIFRVQAVIEKTNKAVAANWMALLKPAEYFLSSISGNESVFRIEPLERGFGVTLGNALRRIMLSSLQGAAVIAVKVSGVSHEFSTIAGVKEDMTEIVLNVKNIVFSNATCERRKLKLSATGPCIVTAGMIEQTADLVVLNKDLEICTVDKGASIEMEFVVAVGKGYVAAANHVFNDLPIGTVAIDAIFSPVRRVAYKIENSRVGAETEFDRLFLTIETNGAVAPDMALGLAAKIMQEQLQVFISFQDIDDDKEPEEEKLLFDVNLLRKIDDLELSVRSGNCLKNDNIIYIGDLVIRSEQKMLQTPNFGKKSLNEIKEILTSMNLKFGMEIPGGWPPKNLQDIIQKYEHKLQQNEDSKMTVTRS